MLSIKIIFLKILIFFDNTINKKSLFFFIKEYKLKKLMLNLVGIKITPLKFFLSPFILIAEFL
jgi:hypothetical protein